MTQITTDMPAIIEHSTMCNAATGGLTWPLAFENMREAVTYATGILSKATASGLLQPIAIPYNS